MTNIEATCSNCAFSIRDGARCRCGLKYYQTPASERKTPKLITFPEMPLKHSCLHWSDSVSSVFKPNSKSPEVIYYLPGFGGLVNTGLGKALMDRGFDVTGRETVGEFKALGFARQVEVVAHDIQAYFWRENAHVICNSFGAYLFLHAQALIGTPYIGQVILLSPIVGEFANDDEIRSMNFVPPQAEKLLELANTGTFPVPLHCEIHVGSEDWQSYPNANAFGKLVGMKVNVVDGDIPKIGFIAQHRAQIPKQWRGRA